MFNRRKRRQRRPQRYSPAAATRGKRCTPSCKKGEICNKGVCEKMDIVYVPQVRPGSSPSPTPTLRSAQWPTRKAQMGQARSTLGRTSPSPLGRTSPNVARPTTQNLLKKYVAPRRYTAAATAPSGGVSSGNLTAGEVTVLGGAAKRCDQLVCPKGYTKCQLGGWTQYGSPLCVCCLQR